MKNFLKNNIRGIFYGFFLSIGLIFLIEILKDAGSTIFFISSGILYFIFLSELFASLIYSRKILTQMEIPQVDTYSKASQIAHHFILPSVLYLSFLGIIYYYYISLPVFFFFVIAFFIFSLLFINVRAYYEDKFKLEERTHYIYDIIKFITFFQLTNTIFETQTTMALSPLVAYIGAGIVSFFISTLVVIRRRQLSFATFLFNIVTALLIFSTTSILYTKTEFNPIGISLYTLLVFYIMSAILHHKLEGTLTKEILLEYISVALLTLAILQGLTN